MDSRKLLLLILAALCLGNGWLLWSVSRLQERQAALVLCLDDACDKLALLETQEELHYSMPPEAEQLMAIRRRVDEIAERLEEPLVFHPDSKGVSGDEFGIAPNKSQYLLINDKICTMTRAGSAAHVAFSLEEGLQIAGSLLEMGETALELRRQLLEAQREHLLDQIATENYYSFDSEEEAPLPLGAR